MASPAAADTGRVVCFGELLLRLSPPGRELPFQSPRLDARFGGAEANVAASLALLGHEAAMVSALSDNAVGHACVAELRRHGVDVQGVRHAQGRMGLYYLTPGALHRPTEVIYDRAGSVFALTRPEEWDWPVLLQGARWLHLSGVNLALGELTTQATLAAVRAAHALGVAVSFDCNHRASLWGARAGQASRLLRELVAEAQVLFAGERDIALLLAAKFPQAEAGERFAAASRLALAEFPRLRLMASTSRRHDDVDTLDLCGQLATRDAVFSTGLHRLTAVVDRIGSGDAFAAGILHGVLRGMPERDALDFATAAACLKHSVPGDVNLLREADMQAFLSKEGFDVKR